MLLEVLTRVVNAAGGAQALAAVRNAPGITDVMRADDPYTILAVMSSEPTHENPLSFSRFVASLLGTSPVSQREP